MIGFEGMLWAAYGLKIISGSAAEWQIDQTSFTQTEKENLKHQWKQWIDATTHGFKDELRAVGMMI